VDVRVLIRRGELRQRRERERRAVGRGGVRPSTAPSVLTAAIGAFGSMNPVAPAIGACWGS
jgi:hypothetical protein